MKSVFITAVLFLMSVGVYAQGPGMDMLNISPTPNSLSRAEATTSVAEGAASIFSNPALLALNTSSSMDLGYSFWIADLTNIFGGVNFKNGRRAVAFSFYSAGSDDYRQSDSPGPSNGTFSIQNLSIAAAYAYDFSYFSLGGAVQYLNEENFTYRASGYAFNVGLARYFLDGRVRTGASVSNLGEMSELNVTATTLPSNFKVGTSADIVEISAQKNDDLPILISVYTDFVYPLNDTDKKDYADYTPSDPHFNFGLGFKIADAVQLSGGYKFRVEDLLDRDFSGYSERPLAFGAAFISDEIKFSYALIPFNTGYGTVHSIGIQYKF